jgi:hypothetical protein
VVSLAPAYTPRRPTETIFYALVLRKSSCSRTRPRGGNNARTDAADSRTRPCGQLGKRTSAGTAITPHASSRQGGGRSLSLEQRAPEQLVDQGRALGRITVAEARNCPKAGCPGTAPVAGPPRSVPSLPRLSSHRRGGRLVVQVGGDLPARTLHGRGLAVGRRRPRRPSPGHPPELQRPCGASSTGRTRDRPGRRLSSTASTRGRWADQSGETVARWLSRRPEKPSLDAFSAY